MKNIVRKFLHLPKIPGEIFQQAIGFFKDYSDLGVEVMLRVHFDTLKQEYVIECPFQKVSATRIKAFYDSSFLGRNSLRYKLALEIHSHNKMPAFFSTIDDEDEKAFCFYGVVGRMQEKQFEYTFRVKVNETFAFVSIKDIFDISDIYSIEPLPYPEEWNRKVKVKNEYKNWT